MCPSWIEKIPRQKNFLDTCKAEGCFDSAGQKNSYGHPHKETLKRLQEYGVRIYNTQEAGAVTIRDGWKKNADRGIYSVNQKNAPESMYFPARIQLYTRFYLFQIFYNGLYRFFHIFFGCGKIHTDMGTKAFAAKPISVIESEMTFFCMKSFSASFDK
mgnify:CR=1 FL=1